MMCGNLGEYIIGLLDHETDISWYREIGKMVITDGSFKGVDNIAVMFSRLEQIYQKLIDQQLYSKELGVWGYFSPIEIQRLKEILDSETHPQIQS